MLLLCLFQKKFKLKGLIIFSSWTSFLKKIFLINPAFSSVQTDFLSYLFSLDLPPDKGCRCMPDIPHTQKREWDLELAGQASASWDWLGETKLTDIPWKSCKLKYAFLNASTVRRVDFKILTERPILSAEDTVLLNNFARNGGVLLHGFALQCLILLPRTMSKSWGKKDCILQSKCY